MSNASLSARYPAVKMRQLRNSTIDEINRAESGEDDQIVEKENSIIDPLQTTPGTLRLYLVQSVGGFGADGSTGGGVLSGIALAREWQSLGVPVRILTNRLDTGSSVYDGLEVTRMPAVSVPQSAGFLSIILGQLLNFWLQIPQLRIVAHREGGGRSLIIASGPFVSDIMSAAILSHSIRALFIVRFHHKSPPFRWFPLRRGGVVRAAAVDFLGQTSLFLTKLAGGIPAMDHPGELERSAWRFERILKDQPFIEPREVLPYIDPSDRGIDACFISRLAPSKGILDLLDCWTVVHTIFPRARLVIAGASQSARFFRKVERLIHSMNLSGVVTLRSYIDGSSKRALLANSRLFLFPSYEEGWSLAVESATLFGTVPIVYDLPAYDYLSIPELRVAPGNTMGLAQAAIRLLSDSDLMRATSKRVLQETVHFSSRDVAKAQLSIFERLVG
jgi:glycosyltransferase involved in cell wall biosynthesis